MPTLLCAAGAVGLFNLIFLLGAEKFSKSRALCAGHFVLCVLAGVLCGYSLVLMMGLDNGLGNIVNIVAIAPMLPYLGVVAGLPFVFLIYPKMKKAAQAVCAVLICVAIAVPILLPFIPEPFEFITAPLVLDIGGDRYSVVFATNRVSVGILDYLDGEGKTVSVTDDSYGRSNTGRVHRVLVPRDALNGGTYSVRAVEVKLSVDANTTFGDEIKSAEYNFKGEYKDELNILAASDVHDQPKRLLDAAKNFSEPDIILMLGDFASNYNSEDIFIDNVIAAGADVTKSVIPAIFARGNHEMFGRVPEVMYESLGLDSFYYQVRRGKYMFTVCDGAADWDSEFKPGGLGSVRDSAIYREEQLQWLETLPVPKEELFHFAAIHIPNFHYGSPEAQARYFKALDKIGVDMQFSGHTHTLDLIKPGDDVIIDNDRYALLPFPLLIDGGGYSGDYPCAMAQVSADGTVKVTAFTNTGKQELDDTLTIK